MLPFSYVNNMEVAQREEMKTDQGAGQDHLHQRNGAELSLEAELDAHQANIFIPGLCEESPFSKNALISLFVMTRCLTCSGFFITEWIFLCVCCFCLGLCPRFGGHNA